MNPFQKPVLTIAQQISQLTARGLVVNDSVVATKYLKFIGYFRLKEYARFFEHPEAGKSLPVHTIQEGVTFEQVLNLYIFDRELRLLVMDAIERIEVALRSLLSNTMCEKFGCHWYMDKKHFQKEAYHKELLKLIEDESGKYAQGDKRKGRPEFLTHYFDGNYDEPYPPSWMLCEVLSFTCWSKIYQNLSDPQIKKQIAQQFKVNSLYLDSWLHALVHLRNICAHHNYCWNRRFTIAPPALWIAGALVKQNNSFYAFAYIIHTFLLAISPESSWTVRLRELFEKHHTVPISEMGFPEKWQEIPAWGLLTKLTH